MNKKDRFPRAKVPVKKCAECGEEAVITHSVDLNTWCFRCGSYHKVKAKKGKKNESRQLENT